MWSVLEHASQTTSKTVKENFLQDYGLHDIIVSQCIIKTNLILFEQKALALLMGFSVLWSLLSIFIQHITFRWSWEMEKAYMVTCSQGFGGQKEPRKIDVKVSLSVLLTDIHHPISSGWNFSMRKFPTWNNLKHFNHISTISFTDGQSFYDILKVNCTSSFVQSSVILLCCIQCILLCIMQLLSQNLPLIHCIWAYQCYQIMIELQCMTDWHLKYLEGLIKDYKRYCSVCVRIVFSSAPFHPSITPLRKYQRNMRKTLTSLSSITHHMSFQIYGKKEPLITHPHVLEKDSNKRLLKHISRQAKRKPKNR